MEMFQLPMTLKIDMFVGFQMISILYFLHMKFNEGVTTLKDIETINGSVKNLSKRMQMKILFTLI